MINLKKFIEKLNKDFAIQIKDEHLLKQAFLHSSYVNEQRHRKLQSNERLEFLGDAVLEVIVSDFLYKTYPHETEGNLSLMRAQLVREPSLALLARRNQFNQYLKLGRGEMASGGHERDSILADCFEAVLGALYLDQGLNLVECFINQELLVIHQEILTSVNQDYKTKFQELVQQQGQVLIEYKLLSQTGPAHNQIFEMGLYVNGQLISQGSGKTKKNAEMKAAQFAYENWQGKE